MWLLSLAQRRSQRSRMIVDTDTGEILDPAPLRNRPTEPMGKTYRRRTSHKDDSALFIGLLGLLVAAIAITK